MKSLKAIQSGHTRDQEEQLFLAGERVQPGEYRNVVTERENINLRIQNGQTIEFKFIQKTLTGDVRWEEGRNRVFDADNPNSTTHWGAFR